MFDWWVTSGARELNGSDLKVYLLQHSKQQFPFLHQAFDENAIRVIQLALNGKRFVCGTPIMQSGISF